MTAPSPVQTTAAARLTSPSAGCARLLQRKCGCGASKAGISDDCTECQGKRLQRKLAVGSTNDPLEAEADQVAAEVMARPALAAGVSHAPPRIQRLSDTGGGGGETAPASVERVLSSPGRPLEPVLRADMEQRFGHDFSRVRVHTDASAEQSAQDVNAHAYTAGHSVVFGAGRYAPWTQEGRRLIAHELTHVRQQSTGQTAEVVQRQPTQDPVTELMLSLGGRRFVFWAKSRGKLSATANAGQITALHDEYKKVETTKDVLEAFDRAQLEMDRSTFATRREAARAAEDVAAETKPERSQRQREQRRHQTRALLHVAIKNAWNERRKYEDPHYTEQAKFDAANRVGLLKALSRQHWKSDPHRWVYIRKYYSEYSILYPESFAGSFDNEDELALYAALVEESYLEKAAQAAEAAELGAYRKGFPKAARTETIKKLAAQRPMNPLEDFEPGVHDYSPYRGQPGSVDVDVKSADFDAKNITIAYNDGKELQIPLGQTNLIFALTPLDPAKVSRLFTRRHKKSQRLIPFVIYENTASIDLDALPENELALMGWARFDPSLTPIVAQVLSPEFKFQKAAGGALRVAAITAAGLPLRQLGVPLASGAIGIGSNILTGAARTGTTLTTAAAKSISSTVTTYGYSPVAVEILGRQAFTYYLTHALQINLAAATITDVVVTLGGGDTGVITPGDQVAMAVAETKAGVKAAQRYWKLLDFTVTEVNLAKGEAKLRITGIPSDISEEAAKAFNYGKNLAVFRKPLGRGKVALRPDPRYVPDIGELNRIHKQLETQLPKLAGKYKPEALKRLTNLTADQIREAQIHPSDLEKLFKKLNSAGGETRDFINNFHDAPNFEQVVLNWAKSQAWTTTWNAKTQTWDASWKASQSMRGGTHFLMKFCNAELKGKKVRFEWPMSIKDTRWGDEVWARHVDVIVEDGSNIKPGQPIYIELKSWTERTLRQKTPTQYGLQYQLTRDTALLGPDNIRWVFDGTKIKEDAVIDSFLAVIRSDPYLRSKWGQDEKAIRAALKRVIKIF